MRQSLRLGHLAGIPVGADWSVFVILALIAGMLAGSLLPKADPGRPAAVYRAVAIPTAVLFLASLLPHEGAHALVARKKGIRVRCITLWMLGGVAQLGGEPGTARADFRHVEVGRGGVLGGNELRSGVVRMASSARSSRMPAVRAAWTRSSGEVPAVILLAYSRSAGR